MISHVYSLDIVHPVLGLKMKNVHDLSSVSNKLYSRVLNPEFGDNWIRIPQWLRQHRGKAMPEKGESRSPWMLTRSCKILKCQDQIKANIYIYIRKSVLSHAPQIKIGVWRKTQSCISYLQKCQTLFKVYCMLDKY